MKQKQAQARIEWVDLLRVVACFLVVLSHACDPFVGQFDNDRTAFLTGTGIGSLVRPCVPLFVMMTGVLLLPVGERDRSLTAFYRRRLGRLVIPLAFWSIMLPIMGYCYFNFVNPDTANAMLAGGLYETERFIPRMWTWIFNFNYDTTALWYLYMLVGLYLIMPILNAWLVSASRRDIRTVLCIWIASLLLPYVNMAAPALGYEGNYGNFGLLGVCDWNAYGSFYYLSGFIGYIILAYYLKTWPLQWSGAKTAAVMLPMFAVGYAITFGGYVAVQAIHPGDYAFLEVIWLFCGINVFMMTLPVFVLIQRLKFRPRRWIATLASLTFGIYLIHFPLESVAYDIFAATCLPYWARILSASVAVFAVTAAIARLLQLWPPTRRLIS
ncbi:MAG: acyltransferase [Muribaculaceae bacterium]|nr:acyltransferase [Muribaculaceae bacterium]